MAVPLELTPHFPWDFAREYSVRSRDRRVVRRVRHLQALRLGEGDRFSTHLV